MTDSATPRINYQALPSHTFVPFTLLAVYPFLLVLSATSADFTYTGDCVTPFLVLGAMVFVVFFVNAIRSGRKQLKPLQVVSPVAYDRVSGWTTLLGPRPKILVSEETKIPYVFQGKLVLSQTLVERIEEALDESDEAVILHELAHALTGDSQRISIILATNRLLLFGTLLVLSISLIALVLVISLDWAIGTTEFADDVRELLSGAPFGLALLFAFAGLYVVQMAGVRSVLQRSCEFLADAFVLDIQRKPDALRHALARMAVQQHLGTVGPRSAAQDRWSLLAIRGIHDRGISSSNPLRRWIEKIQERLFPTHPTFPERLAALDDPWLALDMQRTSIVTGVLVCFLFALSFEFSQAWIFEFNQTWIVVSTAIAGYFSLASYSVAHVLRARSSLGGIAKGILRNLISVLLGIGIGLLFLGMFAVLFLGTGLIVEQVYPPARVNMPSLIQFVETAQSLLLGLAVAFPILTVLLIGDAMVARELLTWYGNPLLAKHPATVFLVSNLLSPYSALVSVGALRSIVTQSQDGLFNVLSFVTCCFPFMAWVLAWPQIAFLFWARRYRRHCVNCGKLVDGHYYLGRKCAHCGYELNKWLFEAKPEKKWGRVFNSAEWAKDLWERFLEAYARLGMGLGLWSLDKPSSPPASKSRQSTSMPPGGKPHTDHTTPPQQKAPDWIYYPPVVVLLLLLGCLFIVLACFWIYSVVVP